MTTHRNPSTPSGRHAFLLASHTDPDMTCRLVRALGHPRVDVFVHVDRKVDPAPFLEQGGIPVGRPIEVRWGGWDLVEATLILLREAFGHGDYSHFTHLSGQDYLLKPVEEVILALESHRGQWVDLAWSDEDRSDRWSHYHVHTRHPLKRLRQRAFRLLMRTLLRQEKYSRALPNGIEYGCGSALWTLDRRAVAWLLDFLERRPDVPRFFRNTAHTSEIFIQCLMRSSPFREELGRHGHCIDWSAGLSHPKTYDLDDEAMLLSSGKLFARKFHSQISSALLDRIDEVVIKI